ncbi:MULTISPECIES: DUF305 domain-containing protein [unclassified Brevundimonas]|uniref:DUF305 domain-containing protein n=1 Tax=unclassified Brevundimonas TaxID=2622653 RepID=UPI001431C41E|nr:MULTISPECIES: DUF305 domain-containing protein [unclassified Brevundimonas]
MISLAGMAVGVVAGLAAQQSPPIYNPGAPGAPARAISASEAQRMMRTRVTAEDVRFMQHMIVHHAQAVEMVELLKTRGADPAVRRLGERIALSQEAEMELMRDWLTSQNQPIEAHDLHGGHGGHAGHDAHAHHGAHAGHAMTDPMDMPLMPGMLSPRQMAALAAAEGAGFDRLFLEGMIQHHQGALDMVDELMAHPDSAEEPMLSGFAASVTADQSAEILRMQSLLSELQN